MPKHGTQRLTIGAFARTSADSVLSSLLCELGCDEIVNVAKRDLAEAVRRRHPAGVDLVLDHVGGRLLSAALRCLKEGGRAVLVGYIRSTRSATRTHACAHSRLLYLVSPPPLVPRVTKPRAQR